MYITDKSGKLYIPVNPSPVRRARSNAISDAMHVDESRDKVYIHDLDDEIADIESDEERLTFLPDIEKKLARLPKSVLTTHNPPQTANEVVLYSVPESLSIPKEQDNVRKAIIESRHRAQAKQALEGEGEMEVAEPPSQHPEGSVASSHLPNGSTAAHGVFDTADDIDAMDIC